MDLGAELGAKVYVFWGGREGVESDATKNPVGRVKRFREALNFLCEYVRDQGYDLKFALEAKPNEPRGDIYLPTTGAMLGFIATLDHPEMVGVNPEVAHEHMAGLNFLHAVAQAWDAGKLFHIDLNDQDIRPLRPGLALRLAEHQAAPSSWSSSWKMSATPAAATSTPTPTAPKTTRASRTSPAAACARYLILKEKARPLQRRRRDPGAAGGDQRRRRRDGRLARANSAARRPSALKAAAFDRQALGARGLVRTARPAHHRAAAGRAVELHAKRGDVRRVNPRLRAYRPRSPPPRARGGRVMAVSALLLGLDVSTTGRQGAAGGRARAGGRPAPPSRTPRRRPIRCGRSKAGGLVGGRGGGDPRGAGGGRRRSWRSASGRPDRPDARAGAAG